MPARTLVRVAGMTHKDRPSVELEHDIGDCALAVVEALSFTEAEDLADPIGRETRILVREHRDDALLSHGRPPCVPQQMMHSRAPDNAVIMPGMTDAVVDVRELRKTFSVTEREEGLAATLRSFVKRHRKDVNAVAGITFRIEPGEVVGFLGPNGAGKTTTLKMLSGLLHPSAGEASVLGYVPWRRENAYLGRMTLLMGNRTQLVWDITAADSFRVLQEIYRIPEGQVPIDRERAYRAPRAAGARSQACAQPLPRRAHEGRVRCGPHPLAERRLSGRADDRARHLDAGAHPPFRRGVQPPERRHHPPDQPLHGRRGGALQARDRHSPRDAPVRRASRGPRREDGTVQGHHRHAPRRCGVLD